MDYGIRFLPGGATFQQDCYFVENNNEYVLGLIEPGRIKTWVESDGFKKPKGKFPDMKNNLLLLTEKLKEGDNPVLIRIRLKE